MPKRAVFERYRRELSLHTWVGVNILVVVEQSSLESQSRGCAKTPILRAHKTNTVVILQNDTKNRKIGPQSQTHTMIKRSKKKNNP